MGDSGLDNKVKGPNTVSARSKGYGPSARCAYCHMGITAGISALKPDANGSLQPVHIPCAGEYDSQQRWLAMSPTEKQGELEGAMQKVRGVENSIGHISDLERSLSPEESFSFKRAGELLLYSLVPGTYAYRLHQYSKKYDLTNPPASIKDEWTGGCGYALIEILQNVLIPSAIVTGLHTVPAYDLPLHVTIMASMYLVSRAILLKAISHKNSNVLEKTRRALLIQLEDAHKTVHELKEKIAADNENDFSDEPSLEEPALKKRIKGN